MFSTEYGGIGDFNSTSGSLHRSGPLSGHLFPPFFRNYLPLLYTRIALIITLKIQDDVDKNLLGSQSVLEDLLLTLSPLLERQPPSREMCTAFSNHCRHHPRSSLVRGLFTTIVHRILKHNVDFGKNPFMRRFVQEYVRVLYAHNDGPQAVRDFVRR